VESAHIRLRTFYRNCPYCAEKSQGHSYSHTTPPIVSCLSGNISTPTFHTWFLNCLNGRERKVLYMASEVYSISPRSPKIRLILAILDAQCDLNLEVVIIDIDGCSYIKDRRCHGVVHPLTRPSRTRHRILFPMHLLILISGLARKYALSHLGSLATLCQSLKPVPVPRRGCHFVQKV
jgi:hypothetical protein